MQKILDLFLDVSRMSRVDLGINMENDANEYMLTNDGWSTLLSYSFVNADKVSCTRRFVFPKTYLFFHFMSGIGFNRSRGLSGSITKFSISVEQLRNSMLGDIFIDVDQVNSYIADVSGASLVVLFTGKELHEEMSKSYPFYEIETYGEHNE